MLVCLSLTWVRHVTCRRQDRSSSFFQIQIYAQFNFCLLCVMQMSFESILSQILSVWWLWLMWSCSRTCQCKSFQSFLSNFGSITPVSSLWVLSVAKFWNVGDTIWILWEVLDVGHFSVDCPSNCKYASLPQLLKAAMSLHIGFSILRGWALRPSVP